MTNTTVKRNTMNNTEIQKLQTYFVQKGLKVIIRNRINYHMTVIGEARKVEFYPTTGTVTSNPVKNKDKSIRHKPYKHRGMGFERAKEQVYSLAKIGY
jgi:hypothetical protein